MKNPSLSNMGVADAHLVATVLSGEVEAFGDLVARYRDPCWRFAIRMLGDRDDAEDAIQEAFVRAFRHLHSCRDRDRFGAWLYRIAVNECRTRANRRARRERRFVDELATLAAPPPAHDDIREEIDAALAQLVPEQREAFILKHVEELSYEEMAEVTGAGVSALKMRVKRGCERLRELLDGVVS